MVELRRGEWRREGGVGPSVWRGARNEIDLRISGGFGACTGCEGDGMIEVVGGGERGRGTTAKRACVSGGGVVI